MATLVGAVLVWFLRPLLAAAAKARKLDGGAGCFVSRVGLRKSRGWDFKAVSRSLNVSWRWSESIDGEH